MNDISPATEGWAGLVNARKWHYFRGARSLCGKWAYLGTAMEQGNDDSPDNCAACRTALAGERQSPTATVSDPPADAGTKGEAK